MIKNKKGVSLVEVVLAVAIFAVTAMSLLGVYLQAVKTDVAARKVLDANYITQDYIEHLDTQTYEGALYDIRDNHPKELDGRYLSAAIKPHGAAGSPIASYMHALFLPGNRMLAVMPDGQWWVYSNATTIAVNVGDDGSYTFRVNSTAVRSGTAGNRYCALIVNAMHMPDDISLTVNMTGSGCEAAAYCTNGNQSRVTLSGIPLSRQQKHIDVIAGDSSLIHVTVRVYDAPAGGAPVAESEAYIPIKNW